MGRREIEKLAGLLKRMRLRVGAIWHSDRVRAVETARILARAVKGKMIERENLGPEDAIGPMVRRISKARADVMIVGHLPHLGELASKLLTKKSAGDIVNFHTGTIAALSQQEKGKWGLEFLISPDTAAAGGQE